MNTRGLMLCTFVVVCVAVMGCARLPEGNPGGAGEQVDPSKFADTIPLDYGNLIAVTTNSQNPRWVTLWFEKPDKTIVIVGVEQHNWRVWMEPRVIERK